MALAREADSAEALCDGRLALKERLEAEDCPRRNRPLALRKSSQLRAVECLSARVRRAPCHGRGKKAARDFGGKTPHSFSDLFPLAGAQGSPLAVPCRGTQGMAGARRQVVLSFSSGRSRAKFLKLAEQDGILPAHALTSAACLPLFRPTVRALIWHGTTPWYWARIFCIPRPKTPRVSSRVFKGLDSLTILNPATLWCTAITALAALPVCTTWM